MKKRRILVCDDEEGIRESLQLVLGREYDLTFAGHGEEAMRLLEQQHFDLAILDIKMPRINGLEVLKWLRARRLPLPVLMLTAYQSVEMAQETLTQGAAEYVTKPFETQELRETVARVLADAAAGKRA